MLRVRIDDVVIRSSLYPRLEHNRDRVRQYQECVSDLPPIEINQDNWLIDGYHRLQAHVAEGLGLIGATVTHTESPYEFYLLTAERNSKHGLPMTASDKKKFARDCFEMFCNEHAWHTTRRGFREYLADLKCEAARYAECLQVKEKTVTYTYLAGIWDKRTDEERDAEIVRLVEEGDMDRQQVADQVGCDWHLVDRFFSDEEKNTDEDVPTLPLPDRARGDDIPDGDSGGEPCATEHTEPEKDFETDPIAGTAEDVPPQEPAPEPEPARAEVVESDASPPEPPPVETKTAPEADLDGEDDGLIDKYGTPRFPEKSYDIVYADPPWQYYVGFSQGRWMGNHYDLMDMEDIKALPVADICNDDACLFLWGTAPKLVHAIETMQAWGFEYVTNMVWDKEIVGQGEWSRGRHEHLLIGRRGKFKSPRNKSLLEHSVINERRGKHSEKPARVAEMIKRLFPDTERIELFARRPMDGFDAWGKEAPDGDNTPF